MVDAGDHFGEGYRAVAAVTTESETFDHEKDNTSRQRRTLGVGVRMALGDSGPGDLVSASSQGLRLPGRRRDPRLI